MEDTSVISRPSMTRFPITDGSLHALHSIASVRHIPFKEVLQEARLSEWALKDQITNNTEKARQKYFWKTLYCRITDIARERDNVVAKQMYEKKTRSGHVMVSEEPFYEGQKSVRKRSAVPVESLDQMFDKNNDSVYTEIGMIDSRSFDDIYIEDLLKSFVSHVTRHAELDRSRRSCWSVSLQILLARIEEGLGWPDIQEKFCSATGRKGMEWHRLRLEKVFRSFIGIKKSSARARATRPVSILGYRVPRARASFCPAAL